MNRSTLGRALVGAILFLALGGPAPGAVGSCGTESTVTDAVQFCTDRKVYECDRGRARGDVQIPSPTPCPDDPATPEDESAPAYCNWIYCRSLVAGVCATFSWPSDCNPQPTTAVTTPCLNALRDASRLSTPSADIPECNINVICPVGAGLTEALEETDVGPIHESPGTPEGI